jgi:SAM-dependent methyltransferase/uncharacterized protein YbaR (Trm112 family)
MRTHLMPLLRCPLDGGPLELVDAQHQTDAWVETGRLLNPRLGRHYAIEHGVVFLHADDASWEPKAREALGWVQFHKDHNIYAQDGTSVNAQLPYFPHEPWIDIARQFDIALDLLQPRADEWVLDVGAGRGWAAKHFALRGCQSVALDVVSDDQVGLGSARAVMQEAGVWFDMLIADSENMPFAAHSFDIAFCSAALHHTTDLERLLANIGRVLRPGGRLVAINEPCIAQATDRDELSRTVLAEELGYGINETRPRLSDYRRALQRGGLTEQAIFAQAAYKMTSDEMCHWSEQLGVATPPALAEAAPAAQRADAITLNGWCYSLRWMDNLLQQLDSGITIVATR